MELGRTPTRQEFEDRTVGGNYRLRKIGGYSVLMQAAGLDPTPAGGQPKKKITNAVFDRKIEEVLDNYKPREIPPKQPWPRIACETTAKNNAEPVTPKKSVFRENRDVTITSPSPCSTR